MYDFLALFLYKIFQKIFSIVLPMWIFEPKKVREKLREIRKKH